MGRWIRGHWICVFWDAPICSPEPPKPLFRRVSKRFGAKKNGTSQTPHSRPSNSPRPSNPCSFFFFATRARNPWKKHELLLFCRTLKSQIFQKYLSDEFFLYCDLLSQNKICLIALFPSICSIKIVWKANPGLNQTILSDSNFRLIDCLPGVLLDDFSIYQTFFSSGHWVIRRFYKTNFYFVIIQEKSSDNIFGRSVIPGKELENAQKNKEIRRRDGDRERERERDSKKTEREEVEREVRPKR